MEKPWRYLQKSNRLYPYQKQIQKLGKTSQNIFGGRYRIRSYTCVMQNSNQAKKTSKSTEKRTKRDMNELKGEQTKMRYNVQVRNQYATLIPEESEQSPEEDIEAEWNRLTTSLTWAVEATVSKKKRTARKEWMTEEILQKMDERKGAKNEIERYRVLDRQVHTMCDKAKENWINQQCSEIEELESKHKTREMYEKVKEVIGRSQEIVVLRTKKGRCCLTNKKFKIDGQNT